MLVREKIAYFNGLKDGLTITDEATRKLFDAMSAVLDEMANAIEDNECDIGELDECIEDIYEELDELDEACFEDDDCCDCDCDCDCSCDDDDFIETVCPECGETVYFSSGMFNSGAKLTCPSCSAVVVPEISESGKTSEE